MTHKELMAKQEAQLEHGEELIVQCKELFTMCCRECQYEFYHTAAKWIQVPGGGTIAVCLQCESSEISDKEK